VSVIRAFLLKGYLFQSNRDRSNQAGRVMDARRFIPDGMSDGSKQGCGVIGTNKPGAEETVKTLIGDIERLNPCSVQVRMK